MLENVTNLVTSLLPSSEASLILWDAERETFSVSSSTIVDQPPQFAGRRARQQGGASRWIIDHQQPVVVGNVDADPFTAAPMLREASMTAYLGVPIVFQGDSLGVLYALDREPRDYEATDVDFMMMLATRAANAIGFARLFEQVNALATTDELTGVANRREFVRRGNLDFERERRAERELALLVMDVDEFKAINDLYGHEVGDEVLRQIAARCSGVVRSIDLVARIGGEEFAVLLPEADEASAVPVAERLRNTIADRPFETSGGPLEVTATIGVAVRDHTHTNLADLMRWADRALYEGKRTGKNRVVIAGA